MGGGTSKKPSNDSVRRILRQLLDTQAEKPLDLISTIEQAKALNNGLCEEEEEMYAEVLYRLSANQRVLFDSVSPNLFRILVGIIRQAVSITYKKEAVVQKVEQKLTDQEQIEKLRTSVENLKVEESGLRRLDWATKAVEALKSEPYFSMRLPDLYMLFHYYLLLYHCNEALFSVCRQKPEYQVVSVRVSEHIKLLLRYIASIPDFMNYFLRDNSSAKFLVYLCTQSLLELTTAKFLYYNDMLATLSTSERFHLLGNGSSENNILSLYVNNTLMLLLIPELSGRRPIAALSYKGSMEYMSIILGFMNALVEKGDFAEAYMQLTLEYEIDMMWYVLWYSCYHPDEGYFINASILLLKIAIALFPSNPQPIYSERLMLSVATTLVHKRKVLSLKVLRTLLRVFPVTRDFTEKFFGLVEEMVLLEKPMAEKNVYNMSAQVMSSYLILLCRNVKGGKTMCKEVLGGADAEGGKGGGDPDNPEDVRGEDKKEAKKEAEDQKESEVQKKIISQFFGLTSLYKIEISRVIAEVQVTEYDPLANISGLRECVAVLKFDMEMKTFDKLQVLSCMKFWNKLWNSKRGPDEIATIRYALSEAAKLQERWRSTKSDQSQLSLIDSKCFSRLAAIGIVSDSLRRFKADQAWLYRTVYIKLFEYLPLTSTDMLSKSESITLLAETIDQKNVDQFVVKSNYLLFHSQLLSLVASAIAIPNIDPTVVAGLKTAELVKWDTGLWKFAPAVRGSSEARLLMDPADYAVSSMKYIGPDNMINAEWLVVAIRNSFKLVQEVLGLYNRAENVSMLPAKQIHDMVYKAFALFQALTEIRAPVSPWNVSQLQWDAITRKTFMECKIELLKTLNSQSQTKGEAAALIQEMIRTNPSIRGCLAKGIIDANDADSIKFSVETLVESVKTDPTYIANTFTIDQIGDIEKNVCNILDNVLCEKIGCEIIKISSSRRENEPDEGNLIKMIKACVGRMNSEGAQLGNMVMFILLTCLKQGLTCTRDPTMACKLANSYLNFINNVKNAITYLKTAFSSKSEFDTNVSTALTWGLNQLSTLRRDIDMKALCFFSVLSRNADCADALGHSSLLTHFVCDCGPVVTYSPQSVLITSIFLHHILINVQDVVQLLKNQDGLSRMLVELVKSPQAPMEALCILIKIVRMVVDVMPAENKKCLREIIPTISGFMSSSYPQIMRPGKTPEETVFGVPEMVVAELWQNAGEAGGYIGQKDLAREVRYIIEELSQIKADNLASMKANLDKKKKLVVSNELGENEEIVKARKELYEIQLRNKGAAPTDSNSQDYNRYYAAMKRIKKCEDEKPTILDAVDEVYREMVKQDLHKK